MSTILKTKPELMSPAGGWPQMRAAVEAGADAVYFGLDHFSARAKVGFQPEELDKIFDFLHRYDVKGFVTFNTLVFDNELHQAETAIQAIAQAGADAIIVQDFGIASLAAQIAPDLEIHGSTQMSVTSAEGVELAATLGCNRVVLGRELSLDDIRKITDEAKIESEVFVHGALCVSYSGQCFSSEAWGGRSANRGKCAQACRLSYELFVDEQWHDTGSNRYLLSPGDLYAIEQIPELIELGVSCFKIEGRYKDENYVALTTRAYRDAIDAAWDGRPRNYSGNPQQQLEQIYSRGLGAHFISGTNHQVVVEGRAPRHRGVKVGRVIRVNRNDVVVQLFHEVFPGDGVVFDAADWRSPDEPEEGGNIYEADKLDRDLIRLSFAHSAIEFDRIRVGDLVWRTASPKLVQLIKPVAKTKTMSRTQPVDMQATAYQGKPLVVTASIHSQVLGRSVEVQVESAEILEPAQNQQLDQEVLNSQLGRLGGTPFRLRELSLESEAPVFLPVSQLNQMRREIVERLIEARRRKPIGFLTGIVEQWMAKQNSRVQLQSSNSRINESNHSRIHVLVRNASQLEAAIEFAPDSITLDYLELYGLRSSVERIKSSGIVARVASPRILKPSEQKVVKFLLSLECPIVVRSGGLLVDLLRIPAECRGSLIGDFSLNVANTITAQWLLDMGLDSFSPTYDLNGDQVKQLAEWVDPSRIEVIAFSHLPVFHTEHCVFCRFLSEGTDNTNCGHPCEKHKLEIRDQLGRKHPVLADVGCRNTVFGAEAQCSARHLSTWVQAGIHNFRLEFVHETREQISLVCEAVRRSLKEEKFSSLERTIRTDAKIGLTEGSLFVPN